MLLNWIGAFGLVSLATIYFAVLRTAHNAEFGGLPLTSELQETQLISESAFYYSYFKRFVEADGVWDSLQRATKDDKVEFPDIINPLQRFNVYPELLLSWLFRAYNTLFCVSLSSRYSHSDSPYVSQPIDFYKSCVFWLHAVGLTGLFALGARLGGVVAGMMSVLFLIINHHDASRVSWNPVLRECFGVPILVLQVHAISCIFIEGPHISLLVRSLLTTLVFLLSWQLAPFIVLLQETFLFILLVFGLITARSFFRLTACMVLAASVDALLHFGRTTTVLMTSTWPILAAVTLWSVRTTRTGHLTLIVAISSITVYVTFLNGTLDNFHHVTEFIVEKLGGHLSFNSLVYTCNPAFGFIDSATLVRLTTSLLLPLSSWAFLQSARFLRSLKTSRVSATTEASKDTKLFAADLFLDLLSFTFFLGSCLVLRLKAIAVPFLCVSSSRVFREKLFARSKVYALACILCGLAVALSHLGALVRTKPYHPDESLNRVLTWIQRAVPENASFAGHLPTLATIHLITARPIVAHPHFENYRLRGRVERLYEVYRRISGKRYHDILRQLGADFLVLEPSLCELDAVPNHCHFPSLWDRLDRVSNPSKRNYCCRSILEGSHPFQLVYFNEDYVVYKVKN